MSNILLRAPSANQAFQCRDSTVSSDQNALLSVAPYGNLLRDLLNQGCVVVPNSGGNSLPLVHGRFYGTDGATLAALLTVLGTIYAYPIYVPTLVTVSTLNMSVTTGQTGGQVRCAIYSDSGGYPGQLVANSDSGNLTATGTAVETATLSPTVTLEPGWYWLASQATASSTMPSVAAVATNYTNTIAPRLGFDTAAHALATSGEAPTGIAVTGQTYGAFPTVFPSGGTETLNANTPAVSIGV